jgi:N-acetylneuraminic acid mutarotase
MKIKRIRLSFLIIIVFLLSIMSIVSSGMANGDSWIARTSMPEGGATFGAVAIKEKIYAFGGYYYNGEIYYTSEEYQPNTDSWKSIAPMPTPRIKFAIAVVEDKIYIIGGKNGEGTASLSTLEIFDPKMNTWTSGAPIPTARDSMHAEVIGDKIYVIGGQVSSGVAYPRAILAIQSEVYDLKTNSWSSFPNIPQPVADYASAIIDNKIYIIGGARGEPGMEWRYLNITQIYDTGANKWSFGTPIPNTVRSSIASATSGTLAPKRIFVFGGYDDIGHRELNQIYDPITGEWLNGKKQNFYGYGELASAVVNDLIYVIGGSSSQTSEQDFWGYNAKPDEVYNPAPPFPAFTYQYTPIGYGLHEYVDQKITILSPENRTYYSQDVLLCFATNNSTFIGYKLDNQPIVSISGNITLKNLTNGDHNITVFAMNAMGNSYACQYTYFIIAEKNSPFFAIVLAVSIAITVSICGILFYFFRR